jgi:hypothetical protein
MPSQEPRAAVLAPVRHTAVVTNAMMAVTCTMGALGAGAEWHRHQVAVDYVAGEPGVGLAEYVGADNTSANIAVLWLLAYLVTGVMFLTWSWRARCNAERLSTLPHRLARGWTIGGWLVPFFPLVVLEDVWRTSRPGLPDVEDVRELPRARLVHYWWYAALAYALTGLLLTGAQDTEPALQDIALITTVVAVLQIVAAALAVAVVRQITEWQDPLAAPATG